MERIRKASLQFDGKPDLLIPRVWALYAEGTPRLGLWVATDDHDQVVGHALGELQEWGFRAIAWINQVVMDAVAGMALRDQALDAFDNWVDEINEWAKASRMTWQVEWIMMESDRGMDSEVWAKHTGFKRYKTLYRRDVRAT
jgi:hypothetical protein